MLKRLKALIFITLVAFGMTGCGTTGPTKNFTPGKIPQATQPSQQAITETRKVIIQELGHKQGMGLSDSGPDYHRVNNMVRKFSRAAGLGNFSYPVIIADAGKKVNAMAVNGNTIVVFKELLRRVPNDGDLAAVVGHEVSHIIAKHHTDNTTQKRSVGVAIGAGILGSIVGGRVGADAGRAVSDIAGTIGKGFFVNSYGREMEYEADHTGMLLMAKAGYHPQGAISFWSKANQIFGVSGGGSDFLSTHPSEGRRLDRLKAELPTAMQYYKR